MRVDGEAAANYIAVSLRSFDTVNRGELVSAEDETGVVVYKDTPETTRTITLGSHAIKILPKYVR